MERILPAYPLNETRLGRTPLYGRITGTPTPKSGEADIYHQVVNLLRFSPSKILFEMRDSFFNIVLISDEESSEVGSVEHQFLYLAQDLRLHDLFHQFV